MINLVYMQNLVREALNEDIGFLDITHLIIDENLTGIGYFLAKEDFILCGTSIAEMVFKELDQTIAVTFSKKDGMPVKKGERFGKVKGCLRNILTAERVALNFLQRLSGIATVTEKISSKARRYGIKILDTRKTTPLLRALEKYAVRMGGGFNHRFSLTDGVLIKDNHIAIIGVKESVRRAKLIRSALVKIAVEVKNIQELKEALEAGAEHILLDNMTPEEIKDALLFKKEGVSFEISGGINIENIDNYLIEGIDYISLGFITHSAKSIDISLEIEV